MTMFGSIAQVFMGQFKVMDYKDRPAPPPQASMPGGAQAPVIPAVHPFEDHKIDLDAIRLPVEHPLGQPPGEHT